MRWHRLTVVAGLVIAACAGEVPATPSISPTQTPIDSATASPTLTPSASAPASPSLSPSASPAASPTATPTIPPPPTPTITPTIPPSPTPAPTADANGWTELTGFPTYGTQTFISSIAFANGTWVAVGWSSDEFERQGRVWTSVDGFTWMAEAAAGVPEFGAVTHNSVAYFAFAGRGRAPVWKSADGHLWKKVNVPEKDMGQLGCCSTAFDFGRVADATFAGGQLYAAGSAEGCCFDIVFPEPEAALWSSGDGRNWTGPSTLAGQNSFDSVAATGGGTPGLAVVGSRENHAHAVWTPHAAATPDDEAGWTAVEPGLSDAAGWGFLDIASDGARFVAVGYQGEGATDYAPIALVSSGGDWGVAPIDSATTAQAEQIGWADDRFVAVGLQRGGGRQAGLSWYSADGTTWLAGPQLYERAEELPDPERDVPSRPALSAGSQGVVVAATFADGLHVWFAPLSAFSH